MNTRTLTYKVGECLLILPELGLNIEVSYNSIRKFDMLSEEELLRCTTLTKLEFLNSVNVECCGCIQGLKHYITQNAFEEGILIEDNISLHQSLQNHKNIPKVLNLYLSKKNQIQIVLKLIFKRDVEPIRKRCLLHSIKPMPMNNESLTDICLQMQEEQEYCLIDESLFEENLNNYLKRKKFCPTCKENVFNAFQNLKEETKNSECTCSIMSFIQYSFEQQQIKIPYDPILINTIIAKCQLRLPNYQHASTKEDAQEELLICLGTILKEKIQIEWKLKQSKYFMKCLFLQQTGEIMLAKIKMCIRQKLQKLGHKDELEEYLVQQEILKEKLRKKRQMRKLKKKKQNSQNSDSSSLKKQRSTSPSESEKNLLITFGWKDSPSVSPQTRQELQFLKEEHFQIIDERRRQLRERTKQCWCDWCNHQKQN